MLDWVDGGCGETLRGESRGGGSGNGKYDFKNTLYKKTQTVI